MPAFRAPSRPRRFRWWRLVGRLVFSLAVLLAVGVSLVVVLVGSLDRPWVRQRARALAHIAAGVDLDYGNTQVNLLYGVRITDLVVLTPPRFRALTPELVHLDVLEVKWSPRALLRHGTWVTRAALHGLTVTVVLDTDDRTSLSELAGGAGKPAAKRTLPSRLAAELLSGVPPLEHATIEGIALTLLILDAHRAVEHLRVTVFGLNVDTSRARSGWQLHAWAGVPGAPRALSVQREHDGRPTGEATADLQLNVSVSPMQALATLDLRVRHQTLWPTIQVDHLLQGAVHASFDSKPGGIDLSLRHVVLADGAATLDARLELPDALGTLPVLRLGRGTVDLVPVVFTLSANLMPISARRAQLRFDLGPLILARVPRLAPGGHADVEGDFDDLRLRLGAERAGHGGRRGGVGRSKRGPPFHSAPTGYRGRDGNSRAGGRRALLGRRRPRDQESTGRLARHPAA